MSKTKRPYDQVLPVAQHIVEKLTPYCERIEIAGSLRRERPLVGDIEIVLIPKYTVDLLGHPFRNQVSLFLKHHVTLDKDGERYLQFNYGNYQVDVFMCSPERWGSIFMIRTGSVAFNMWVMNQRRHEVKVRFDKGLVYEYGSDEIISTFKESDIFDVLQLEYIPPSERGGDDFSKWVKK